MSIVLGTIAGTTAQERRIAAREGGRRKGAGRGGMEECTRWLKGFVKQVPVEFVAAKEPFWTVSEKR
jgi:hypothetical protein